MGAILLWGWDETNHKWVQVLVDDEGKLEITGVTFPDDYPLPAAQVALLQAVTVGNFPADPSTGGRQDVLTDLISLIRILLDARLPAALDATGGLKVANLFGGATYVNSDTAADDDARRFEAASKKLRDVVIIVKTHDQLFGDSDGQTYPVAVDETIGLTKIDISTLYFKNATADEDGTVHILGVEE